MNKQRRSKIAVIASTLEDLYEELSALRDEEQEYYDNMPESIQNGDKGDAAQQAIDLLDSACDYTRDAADNLASVE